MQRENKGQRVIKLEETERYKLGKLLGQLTRHLLLMTATPHNGKDDDLMRRMINERLLTFEGKRLFPDRRVISVNYDLSPEELDLYESVTE